MSKKKSLARLAIERSQTKEDRPQDGTFFNNSKSSSIVRPLGHGIESDQVSPAAARTQTPERCGPIHNGQSEATGTMHHPSASRAAVQKGSGLRPTRASNNPSRHSYPAAVMSSNVGGIPRIGWGSPLATSPQQQSPSASPQQPVPSVFPHQQPAAASPHQPLESTSPPSAGGIQGCVLPPDGAPRPCGAGGAGSERPGSASSPPAGAGPAAARNGSVSASPTVSSGSSAAGGCGLLAVRPMPHAHSTNDLQEPPADGAARHGLSQAWNSPMTASHRTRSYPAGLAGSMETLSSCSELSVGSPLSAITVQKARSRGYLVNTTGSALLLGSDELNASLPQRQVNLLVGTWNMNAKEPPSCLDDLVLPDCLAFVPDLVVLGTQESHADHRGLLVRLQSTLGPSHVLFHSASLGTLHVCVFIRRDLIWYCSVPEEASFSIRQPTAIKTKGCVAVGFQFFGTTFLLLTCHLTAHLEKQNQRIDDVRRICAALDLPQGIPSRSSSRDVTERYDNVFWFGDLNFRLHQSRPRVIDTIVESSASVLLRERTMSDACMRSLLEWDQLNHAKKKGRAFEGFSEGDITFLPTYKYDPGTNNFDTSSKQRIPAYTDRILFKSRRDGVRCIKYDSVHPFNTSDHKPVWGLYQCSIRPSMDNIPLAAGQFNRAVFLEGLRRRARHLPASRGNDTRPCSVQ